MSGNYRANMELFDGTGASSTSIGNAAESFAAGDDNEAVELFFR